MTFSQYGVTDFTVQGWTGSSWTTLATVSGNNLVKRTVNFNAYTTDRIRINVTGALGSSPASPKSRPGETEDHADSIMTCSLEAPVRRGSTQ